MQVTCEKCSAKYNIADDKIKPTGTAVRCPKCQAVFKVFGGGGGAPEATVACANCGKQTASVPGQAVVFCEDCRAKLAGDPGGGEAPPADDFSGANLFGGAPAAKSDDPFAGNIFGDEPAKPAKPAAPAPPAGGGLFDDDAPAAPTGGGLFDDAPAAPSGGSLFDEPAAPSGGGLFDDAPAAPAAGGSLFDEPAGDTGGGLFDDAPAASAAPAADPFGDFDAPPGGDAPQAAADPFAEFSGQPDDGMGFQETPEEQAQSAPEPQADSGVADALGDEEQVSGPVREKAAPQFKQKEASGKDKALELLAENGPRIGMYAGIGVGAVVILLVASLALLPATFKARPTRADDQPGTLAKISFSLQEKLKTKYYGKAMEDAFLKSGLKAMSSWSGRGFENAEKEYRELLAFDPSNAAAKAALVNLYATWDLVSATPEHGKALAAAVKDAKPSGEPLVRSLLALGQYKQAVTAAAAVADKKEFYTGAAAWYAGDVSAAVPALDAYAKKNAADFLGALFRARALRDDKRYAEAASAYTVAAKLGNGNAQANLELGMLYYGPLAQEDKALRVFSEATDDKAGAGEQLTAEAKYYLAHILQRRGRVPQALDSIQDALKVAPNNARYLTRLGNIYFDISKTYDAFTAYDKARTADPTFVEAYIGLGRAKEKLEKQSEALELYRKAIELDPVNMEANFLYAGIVLREGRKEEAEKVFTAVLEREPNNIEAISHLARFYVDQQRNADALKEYARIIELQPGKIDGYIGRGAVLLLEKDTGGAKVMFEKAAAIEPNNPTVLFRLGQAAYLENDIPTAEKSLHTALEKDPYHWEAHLYLGMALGRQGKPEEALKEYQKTLDVNERAAEAYRQRALVYLKMATADTSGKAAPTFAKAVSEMERALYYEPANADYYYDYGVCLDASGLAGKAKDAWVKAKELRPGFKEAMFAIANYYVSFTDYPSAEAVLKEVLKTSPKNAQAYLGMGKVYLAKGSLDEAYRAFSRAAQLDPKNADAQDLIGEVFDRQGLTDQAFTYFQRALRIDPKHGVAHYNLSLYWKDRDPPKAKKEVKAAIDSGTLTKEKAEEAQEALKELDYVK